MVPADGELMEPEPSELYISVSLPPGEYEALMQRTNTFMLQYPHIQIALHNDYPSADRYDRAVQLGAQGSAPDVMLVNSSWVVPLAVQGYLKPVDSLMSGDVLSDQLPALIEPMKWNGYLWGAPESMDPYFLAWDELLLEQRGLSKPPGSWSEVLAAADSLLAEQRRAEDSGDNRVYLTWLEEGDLTGLLMLLSRFDEDDRAWLRLDSSSEALLGRLSELSSRSRVVASGEEGGTEALQELLENHRLLMAAMRWSDYVKLEPAIRERLMIERQSVQYPWLNSSSYVIAASTRYEEDAMLWIQEMTGTAVGLKEMASRHALPVRASLYGGQPNLLALADRQPPDWWFDALSVKPAPRTGMDNDPGWPITWRAWEAAWKRAGAEADSFSAFADAMPALGAAQAHSDGQL